jgi:Leucine-rich repeat (LRR) protein
MKSFQGVLVYVCSIFLLCNCESEGNADSTNQDPVYIPDRALLYDLITLGIDTNKDSIISHGEAAAVTALDITNYYGNYVTDATGLEAFVNLNSLIFRCNGVAKLDLSQNTKLKQVIAYDNALVTIDISTCSKLEELHVGSEGFCFKNKLTRLDIRNNKRLKILKCGNNQLSDLDITQNPELEVLECPLNSIADLDLSGNSALQELSVWNNELTSLDVSTCPFLRVLDFRGNQLSDIDLSTNKYLETLDACRNFISHIHICCNKALTRIQLSEMPTLTEVCVWKLPFPPEGVSIDIAENTGITFVQNCN